MELFSVFIRFRWRLRWWWSGSWRWRRRTRPSSPGRSATSCWSSACATRTPCRASAPSTASSETHRQVFFLVINPPRNSQASPPYCGKPSLKLTGKCTLLWSTLPAHQPSTQKLTGIEVHLLIKPPCRATERSETHRQVYLLTSNLPETHKLVQKLSGNSTLLWSNPPCPSAEYSETQVHSLVVNPKHSEESPLSSDQPSLPSNPTLTKLTGKSVHERRVRSMH